MKSVSILHVILTAAMMVDVAYGQRLLSRRQCAQLVPEMATFSSMESRFSEYRFVSDLTDCITCACPNRDTACCSREGNMLRELAPIAFDSPSTSCTSQRCHCIRREGSRIMTALRTRRSAFDGSDLGGISYAGFHDRIRSFYKTQRLVCAVVKPN